MDDAEKIIVTRHKPLVDWLRAQGVMAPVIEHASAADVRGKHVYGVVPMYLAAVARTVTEVSMPGLTLAQRKRRRDLSVAEMDAAGANLQTFVVRRF